MKKSIFAVFTVVLALLTTRPARAESDWAIDILPGALLANFSADDFNIVQDGRKEEVSMISSVPSIALGLAIERMGGYIDVKGGLGMVLNGKFSSYMIFANGGMYKEIRPSIMMGPHITLAQFTSPEWWGDFDVEFSDTFGYLFGMHLTAGDRISYLLSVDFLSASFDVKSAPNATVSKDELDISGIAVQFGVRAQF